MGRFKKTTRVDDRPPQPILPEEPIQVVPPSWLLEAETNKRIARQKIELEKAEWLLPSRGAELNEAHDKLNGKLGGLCDDGDALLVVGHQPQLGYLASAFIRSRRGWVSRAVPIASSEVVCLRLQRARRHKWRGRLVWTLAPDDSGALKEVADKVKGKMESAKLLSAVITLVLTALLGVLLDTDRWKKLVDPQAPARA